MSELGEIITAAQGWLRNHTPTGQVHTMNPLDSVPYQLFARCRGLFRSILILIQHNQVEEAVILCRSLQTESLRLGILSEAGSKRHAYCLGWLSDSYSHIERLLRADPDPASRTRGLAFIEEQRRALQAAAQKHGVGRFSHFEDETSMARRLGREDEILDFLVGHHATHGSEFINASRRQADGTDVIRVFDSTQSKELKIAGTTTAVKAILRAFEAMASMFGWSADGLEALLSKIDDLERA